MAASADRLATLFTDLDKVLAVLATPEFQIDELKLRLANNDRCKAQLHKPNRNYTALDLTAIECGLRSRLSDATARLEAGQAREAA
ncbi:hypothetical protein [Methylobacterium gnaphalii]|uniref:Uncharacterized protein n=1 Tax=Methylobacterium gnaphalii TaxID=1010610 RepID=A0A512JIT8_9HYPH|nr:hypothetical protein [Methylobacterium gnaphalii]GEP09866.1 hypothetical protein MGN01_17110 [Methylobacterium gnaphalii]GJD67218.1 hypothetical protein MMMDOFMJ_0132 [Methylobacterium gnaphalii]GLS49895.1 hypothetical protein GCM10007885_27470 [Methylobacterium gnaphalii]